MSEGHQRSVRAIPFEILRGWKGKFRQLLPIHFCIIFANPSPPVLFFANTLLTYFLEEPNPNVPFLSATLPQISSFGFSLHPLGISNGIALMMKEFPAISKYERKMVKFSNNFIFSQSGNGICSRLMSSKLIYHSSFLDL